MIEQSKRTRFCSYLVFLSLLVAIVIGRYFYLMVLVPIQEKWENIALPVVERGAIFDRYGRLLAISSRLDSVAAWRPNLGDYEETATDLAQVLDVQPASILASFNAKPNVDFIWIKRKVTPTESQAIEEYKSEGRLRGISLVPEFGRNYPEQELAAHMLGYVGVDNIGLAGVEYTFNQELSPPVVGKNVGEVRGNHIYLTIDINIQYLIEQAARKAYAQHAADSVIILVMEAQTGDMLGYSSIPSFDPNEFAQYDPESLLNRPATLAYEPGSVFKVFSLAGMLQLGIAPGDTFYCDGFYQKVLQSEQIRIRCLGVHGVVTPEQIIKVSCNAGAAYASETVDEDPFYDMLLRFGFGKATGLFAGETSGILRKPSLWSERTKATIAFGQEISTSPVQVVAAATVFANQGLLLQPHVVKRIMSPQGEIVREFVREPIREVVTPDVAQRMLEMMQAPLQEGGTAWRARVEGMPVSAKTGTAQVYDPRSQNYSPDHFVASFLGIFSATDPQFIVYIVVDHPRGEHYFGGRIASPIFKQIAGDLIGYLGIPTKNDVVVSHSGGVRVYLPKSVTVDSTMPDLRGYPKRLLLPLFAREDITIRIEGDGYVVRQSPKPGTKVTAGTEIILELE